MEPSTGVNGSSIVITAAKINQVNDSLYLPSTDAKYKGSLAQKFAKILADEDVEEITITVESAGLEMENGGTITLPENQTDRPVNLVFTSTFKKSVGQLVIEDKNSLHNLNITLPSGNFGKLKIDTKYSTVNVKSAGTTDVEFSSRSNERSVTLGSGVKATIDDIDDYVKGSEVAALIVKTPVTMTKNGVATKVKNSSGNAINTKSLVIRGNATVQFTDGTDNSKTQSEWKNNIVGNPLEKIIVENNSTLTLQGAVKEIVGVLDADGKINNTTVTITTHPANNDYGSDAYFAAIQKVSNVTIGGYFGPTTLPAISNSKLKFSYYDFSASMSSVKDVEFVALYDNTYFYINVPAQEDASSYTFSFSNVKFPANTHFEINSIGQNPETDGDGNPVKILWYVWYEYDSNGNKIVEREVETTEWFESQEKANEFKESLADDKFVGEGEDVLNAPEKTEPFYVIYLRPVYKQGSSQKWEDIPVYNREKDANGTKGYWWTSKDEPKYSWYNNFTTVFKFDGCKYNGKSFTAETPAFNSYYNYYLNWYGMKVRYEIEGVLYRAYASTYGTVLVKD